MIKNVVFDKNTGVIQSFFVTSQGIAYAALNSLGDQLAAIPIPLDVDDTELVDNYWVQSTDDDYTLVRKKPLGVSAEAKGLSLFVYSAVAGTNVEVMDNIFVFEGEPLEIELPTIGDYVVHFYKDISYEFFVQEITVA